MRLSALSLCIAGLSIPLMAQVPDDLDQELAALLNTPIQGASKREQRLMDSPQAIEVLTGEEIRSMGVHRLVDALKMMTSVDVLEADTQATYVAIRGAMQQGQPRTVQILVDGVPLMNGETGSVDLDTLPVPVDLIDKVEVVRGPSSSLYGANAVSGVIAITTKRPGTGASGGLRYSHAANANHGAADLELGGKKLGITAGYSSNSYGIDRVDSINLPTGKPGVLDNNSGHGYSAFARGQFAPSEHSLLWASLGQGTKTFGTTSTNAYPFQIRTTNTFQLGWSQTWTPTFRTEVRGSRLEQLSQVGPSPTLVASTGDPALASNYKWQDFSSDLLEVQGNWDPTATIHLVGGLDHAKNVSGKAAFMGLNGSQGTTNTGGFLNLDWNLTSTLALSAGARVENQSLGGSDSSPRIALVWGITPTSSLRGGYYSSTRSPQVLERYVDYSSSITGPSVPKGDKGVTLVSPNPSLTSEKIASVEVGYRQQISAVTMDFTVFKMRFHDLINVQQLSAGLEKGVTKTYAFNNEFVNGGSATDQGLEISTKWLVTRTWSMGANATWLDYTLESTGQTPTYVPKSKVNLWNRLAIGPFSSYLVYQHVDSVVMGTLTSGGPTIPTAPRPAIDQLNFNLGWEFKPGLVVSLYGINATKPLVAQGTTGVLLRQAYVQGARREIGVTVGYRF